MAKLQTRKARRVMRHRRVRRRVSGTAARPRFAVFRSLSNIYVQLIDDVRGLTLTSASSLEGQIREKRNGKGKSEVSRLVGTLVAERAKENGVSTVVFDRGGYKYHGRVKELAEAAREGGLVF